MRIFISHSSQEKPLVRELKGSLSPFLSTWIDEDRLLFGCELGDALQNAIYAEVEYFLLLLDRTAVEREWVRKEVAWALDREKEIGRTFLLPVLLDDVRNRFPELGLSEERLALPLPDRNEDSVRLLATRLSNHIAGWMAEMLASIPRFNGEAASEQSLDKLETDLTSLLASTPDAWQREVRSLLIQPLILDLTTAQAGTIPLTREKYYQRVFTTMREAGPGSQVFAVSTLASKLWTHDADQIQYEKMNFDAVRRGAEIHRLFILPSSQPRSFDDVIRRQVAAKILARVASTDLLANVPELEDFVLYDDDKGARAYVAHIGIDGKRQIQSGSLLLSELALTKRRETFEIAWKLATPIEEYFAARETDTTSTEAPPVGMGFESRTLDAPVITCEEAARARGIPLAQELKTLLLQTGDGIVAAHLPGDGTLDLRKVKTRLETAEAYLLEAEDLLAIGLTPGTVCAVLEPVWGMTHLVSRRVLEMDRVATNDGTLTGYFEFAPAALMAANDVSVDDFER